MKPFRRHVAIAVDGGGIRGVMVARALAILEEHLGQTCHDVFRLAAGTSTGSVISAGVGAGLSGAEMHQLYCELGETIFRKGDTADGFYYVFDGKVKLFFVSERGLEKVVEILKPGMTFGEAVINLTDAGVFGHEECVSFGNAYVKSRSSSSFTASLKDFIRPIDVSVSNSTAGTTAKISLCRKSRTSSFGRRPQTVRVGQRPIADAVGDSRVSQTFVKQLQSRRASPDPLADIRGQQERLRGECVLRIVNGDAHGRPARSSQGFGVIGRIAQ